ncbi:amino acid transporter [Microbacterium sp. SORGH_AS_0888]|uniref:amino acid transporter n=1 Tax=Microbacterium sp. SORGH_AS_0888 TaxID=3041791 RepID=UPI00277F1860|nr:amino acid transporter [Microbacterium sp. SORGH_AS_0888]MDQ1130123.1 TRAP-type C4-dicarboxylate transport system permease small subunit [Microbacterium sp. SORGH_AS_0888]
MTPEPTRRALMRPIQLLGLAFVAALFAGVVTLVSMGFFQAHPADEIQRALVLALVVAGITFIVTLLVIALLVLVVDPADVTRTIDRPLLLPPDDAGTPRGAGETGDADADGASGPSDRA